MRTTDEVQAAVARILTGIPPALWTALRVADLIHPAALTP